MARDDGEVRMRNVQSGDEIALGHIPTPIYYVGQKGAWQAGSGCRSRTSTSCKARCTVCAAEKIRSWP